MKKLNVTLASFTGYLALLLMSALLIKPDITLAAYENTRGLQSVQTDDGKDFWPAYLNAFVTPDGRVLDTANDNVSHSEGQGYGMLLAVHAGDRVSFDRLWGWTERELQVREGDDLFAWRWHPDKRPHVGDLNNASDGDILIAWALIIAAQQFDDQGYRHSADKILDDIEARVLFEHQGRRLIAPGVVGFGKNDRSDGPIVNPSYWVFPALEAFSELGRPVWDEVIASGHDLLLKAGFSDWLLPPEWLSVKSSIPSPASGFDPVFGYNAIRVPLYLAGAKNSSGKLLRPYLDFWKATGVQPMAQWHLLANRKAGSFNEEGYHSIVVLAACVLDETPFPADARAIQISHYYPTTLHALALLAAPMEEQSC